MVMKLSNKDVLQLSRAIKKGWLDTTNVECLKQLVGGYNPARDIRQREVNYYLECIYKGLGFKPNSPEAFRIMSIEIEKQDKKLYDEFHQVLLDDTIYKDLIRDIFFGLVALKAIGGTFEDMQPNFEWLNESPPEFCY